MKCSLTSRAQRLVMFPGVQVSTMNNIPGLFYDVLLIQYMNMLTFLSTELSYSEKDDKLEYNTILKFDTK
jgi:hypothetical protein